MPGSGLPSWLSDKGRKQRQNARSRQQEEDHALRVNGRRQPGSGSSPRHPQDVKTQETLDEIKYTDGDRYTISAKQWKRYFANAIAAGREPNLVIEFDDHSLRLRITQED